MIPKFDGNSIEEFGYDIEGQRMILTESKYIWVVDCEGFVTYDGELVAGSMQVLE